MLRLKTSAFVLLSLSLPAGLASAQSVGAGSSLPTAQLLDRFGLERAWWSQATLRAGRDKLEHLTHDEDLVYVQSSSGLVTAFDAETGRRAWAHQLGRRDQHSQPITSNEGVALAVHGLHMYAIQKSNGDVLWTVRLPGAASTSPSADRNHVYVGMVDGSVYAFDLKKIHELYNQNRLPQWSHQTIKWRYQTAREVTTPPLPATVPNQPAIAGAPGRTNSTSQSGTARVVNFASRDKSLYSVDAERRTLNFQFETDSASSAPLTHKDGYLFLPTGDFRIYAINELNGRIRWDFMTGLPVRKQPKVIDDDLFLILHGGGVVTISATTGERKWSAPRATEFLAATPSIVFASGPIGGVLLLSREDGAALGTLPLRQFQHRISNDRTDRLYLATDSGLVVCLRERGREFPIYYRYPEQRPIIPEFASDEATEQE